MRHILYVFVVCFVIQGIVCPPVNQNPTPKPEEEKEDQVWIQNIFFFLIDAQISYLPAYWEIIDKHVQCFQFNIQIYC